MKINWLNIRPPIVRIKTKSNKNTFKNQLLSKRMQMKKSFMKLKLKLKK